MRGSKEKPEQRWKICSEIQTPFPGKISDHPQVCIGSQLKFPCFGHWQWSWSWRVKSKVRKKKLLDHVQRRISLCFHRRKTHHSNFSSEKNLLNFNCHSAIFQGQRRAHRRPFIGIFTIFLPLPVPTNFPVSHGITKKLQAHPLNKFGPFVSQKVVKLSIEPRKGVPTQIPMGTGHLNIQLGKDKMGDDISCN